MASCRARRRAMTLGHRSAISFAAGGDSGWRGRAAVQIKLWERSAEETPWLPVYLGYLLARTALIAERRTSGRGMGTAFKNGQKGEPMASLVSLASEQAGNPGEWIRPQPSREPKLQKGRRVICRAARLLPSRVGRGSYASYAIPTDSLEAANWAYTSSPCGLLVLYVATGPLPPQVPMVQILVRG